MCVSILKWLKHLNTVISSISVYLLVSSRTSGLGSLTKGCMVAVLAGFLLGLGLSHVVRSNQVTRPVTQPTLITERIGSLVAAIPFLKIKVVMEGNTFGTILLLLMHTAAISVYQTSLAELVCGGSEPVCSSQFPLHRDLPSH